MSAADKSASARILVVDDEPDLLTLYELALLREGHEVVTASNLAAAREALVSAQFDVVVTDMRLPDGQGIELIEWLHQQCRTEQSVVITAYGSAESAVQALKLGAFDYLTKPVDLHRFRSVVLQAHQGTQAQPVAQARLRSAVTGAGKTDTRPADRLVGSSRVMRELRTRAVKVAVSMAPVMLRGESGTGKEVLARIIHDCSQRHAGPFVPVNCSAIPETLLEAEFFGVRKGAYTGAQFDREGFFQAACGGTLFLDEIGDLPLPMQAKLLRAIQERTVRPLGSSQEITVDVRIVAATHKPLEQEVAEGRFRQDLYYRLNVIELQIPALRERKEDLSELSQVLLTRIADMAGESRAMHLSEADMLLLCGYDFPGNVRELENLLHRAWALGEGGGLNVSMAMEHPRFTSADGAASTPGVAATESTQAEMPTDLSQYLDEQERRILLKALQQTDYNRTAAAQRLGITLRQIRYRMDRLHIEVPGGRDDFVDTQESQRH